MRLSASWLAFDDFTACLSCSRCCSVRFWFSLMARSSASGLFASCASRPAFASSSRIDSCCAARFSSDFAIFSSASAAAAFSASLIVPDCISLARSSSFCLALAKSPFARSSENCPSLPSCFSSPARSRLSASLRWAESVFLSSSRRFESSLMRRIASRRASSSTGSPPTRGSAFFATCASESRTSCGRAFELSSSCVMRSSACSDAFFCATVVESAGAGSSTGHWYAGTNACTHASTPSTAAPASPRFGTRTGNAARTFGRIPPSEATVAASAIAARA